MAELPFDIAETARRAGRYRWVELALFEVLGRWVESTEELDVAGRLAVHSGHRAWCAEIWERRLPELVEISPDDVTVGDGAALERAVAELSTTPEPNSTIERLAGVYRGFLPHLVAAYTADLDRISARVDGPTDRALRLTLADAIADQRDGELALQSLLRSGDDVARAATQQARVESLIVDAGGICGPSAGPG